LFSDGTNVQKFGTLQFHPIFLSLGNLSAEERKKDSAHPLVGLIPSLSGTKEEKKKESFRNAKRELFQKSLETFMETFDKASQEYAFPIIFLSSTLQLFS